MTLPTKLSTTLLDISITKEYAQTVSIYKAVNVFVNRLHNDISGFVSFESFAWTNYCHHVKKSKRGKTVIGYTRQGEELWRITYKGNRNKLSGSQ